jgi:hypothetical protein
MYRVLLLGIVTEVLGIVGTYSILHSPDSLVKLYEYRSTVETINCIGVWHDAYLSLPSRIRIQNTRRGCKQQKKTNWYKILVPPKPLEVTKPILVAIGISGLSKKMISFVLGIRLELLSLVFYGGLIAF